MARYFFHLRDGIDVLTDPDGRQVADPAQLPGLAIREARSILSQDVLRGTIRLDPVIEVRDESGAIVHQLCFRDALTIAEGPEFPRGPT